MNKTRGSRQARIDPETLEELRRIAKEEMRPVTKMITVIVREWVANREKGKKWAAGHPVGGDTDLRPSSEPEREGQTT